MKKMMILVAIMMLSLTGCGNKQTAEASVIETNELVETSIDAVGIEKFLANRYSEENVENMKYSTIAYFEECWEEEGIPSEDCKDEIIDLLRSIEYDPSFEPGYDLENLQINYVNILVKYNVLPEECYGKNFDDAEIAYESVIY